MIDGELFFDDFDCCGWKPEGFGGFGRSFKGTRRRSQVWYPVSPKPDKKLSTNKAEDHCSANRRRRESRYATTVSSPVPKCQIDHSFGSACIATWLQQLPTLPLRVLPKSAAAESFRVICPPSLFRPASRNHGRVSLIIGGVTHFVIHSLWFNDLILVAMMLGCHLRARNDHRMDCLSPLLTLYLFRSPRSRRSPLPLALEALPPRSYPQPSPQHIIRCYGPQWLNSLEGF